mmetsp:Transcript_13481/g.24137  ORF Transcript_13481/g.24137 Transcript_13481/m.24137 type:complete len:881 (-) Transcript_13481:2343-4985(-)
MGTQVSHRELFLVLVGLCMVIAISQILMFFDLIPMGLFSINVHQVTVRKGNVGTLGIGTQRVHKVEPLRLKCRDVDVKVGARDRNGAIERAVRNVFREGKTDVPNQSCGKRERDEVDFDKLRKRLGFKGGERKQGCIVYLAQKKHSSYGRDSFHMLRRSLDLLYENYNTRHRSDVLVFHEGDFTQQDELDLQQDGIRPEIHLVRLENGSKYWELPGFIDPRTEAKWTDDAFSVGYRHMCRWYSGLLFEYVDNIGYDYVMRMDEDSYLLSEVHYDFFEFMHKHEYEYAFRTDAIEPCCDLQFRDSYISAYLKHSPYKKEREVGFYHDECVDDEGQYINYGYYNNFFVTKVAFWLKPAVRELFHFVDWTGGIYLFRENDLVVQSLSVQMYMPKSKVHKFTDWSYEHVSGGDCEWGAVVKGTGDKSVTTETAIKKYIQKNSKVITVPEHTSAFRGPFDALYCDPTNYRADVTLNLHGAKVVPEQAISKISPFCTNALKHGDGCKNTLPKGSYAPGSHLDEAYPQLVKDAKRFQELLENVTHCSETGKAMWAEGPECGVGCGLNFLVRPLLYAVETKQALLTPSWRWANDDACRGDHRLSCFLRPYAKRDNDVPGCKKHGHTFDDGRIRRQYTQDDTSQFEGKHAMPRVLKEFEQHGAYWNVAQVLKFILTKPPESMQEAINELVETSGIGLEENQPVLGVHVRLGDACSDPAFSKKGRRCDHLEHFIPDIEKMMRTFGFKSIFLATDSAEVIRNAAKLYPQFKWMYNKNMNREKYEVFAKATRKDELTIEGVLFGHKKLRRAGFTPYTEMRDFLLDLYMLAMHSDGFVGKFTSNMDRIVMSLGTSTGNNGGTCLKPAVSLDAPWCFDFGAQSGVGVNGEKFYC